ncbi:MAG: 30S ribosomal protein S18 [Planctomycetes bacterium]|nr:30S ribosomal protein S18 [Planctomycetota bacterium]
MAEFTQFGAPQRVKVSKTTSLGKLVIDYKNAEDLRRLMTPNGKIQSRKRTQMSAREQRILSQAVKRARFMALLPFTSATL